MKGNRTNQTRSVHLSTGSGDLPALAAIVFLTVVSGVSPDARASTFRALLVVVIAVLFRLITGRRHRAARPGLISYWRRIANGIVGVAVSLVCVYVVIRFIVAGRWIDAALISVVYSQIAYLEWHR